MNEAHSDEHASPKANRVSLRDIAAELDISHVTVSKALRNLSGVSESLKRRIRDKAEEMHYVPDPLLASLSRYRSTSKTKPIQSELAWINPWKDPKKLQEHKEFELYWEGAKNNARRLGFRLQAYNTQDIPLSRLETILKARNVQGILLLPISQPSEDLMNFDWSNFSVVRFGQADCYPQAHSAKSSQVSNTIVAFEKMHELGYERIGFVCEYWRTRYFGAGYSWAQKNHPKQQQLPALTLNPQVSFDRQQRTFETWIRKNRPDAILTDRSETHQMLQNIGYQIPQDIGLATTSIHDTSINAGIDQTPYEIGRAAIRMLTALIAERSFGIPDSHTETLIQGNWVDGSMLPKRNTGNA